MINIIKKIKCNHNNRFSFRKYDDFDYTEYYICNDCKKVLNTLKGYDEDIRG